jgi:hypothetical protein
VEQELRESEESRDQISGSWRFTSSQLETSQNELKILRNEKETIINERKQIRIQEENYTNSMNISKISQDSALKEVTDLKLKLVQVEDNCKQVLLEADGIYIYLSIYLFHINISFCQSLYVSLYLSLQK